MHRWEIAKQILARLEADGFEAYLVGGCVRDLLLGRPVDDLDICTSAKPEEVQKLFPQTVATGLKHGTVTVVEQGYPFEVTTFRQEEGYSDFRRPDRVKFVTSLKTDLSRRDFTINAMALDLRGKLYDYFGGLKDLQLRMIRCVGLAEKRMAEDALRMLRAVRFSSQLGFAVDRTLMEIIDRHVHLLEYVARERITQEFRKLLAGQFAPLGLRLLINTGLAKKEPFLWLKGELETLSRYDLSALKEEERWAFLLSLAPPERRRQFLKGFRLSKGFEREIMSVVHLLDQKPGCTTVDGLAPEEMVQWTAEQLKALLKINQLLTKGKVSFQALTQLDHVLKGLPIRSLRELAIDGHDLQRLFNRPPGPWIKKYLDKAFYAVLKGKVLNEQKAIFSFLLEREKDEVD